MHELSIAEAIVETITDSLESGCRVLRVQLQLGDLSGVVADALQFCFDLATEGTPLAGCALDIERIPAALWCHGCARIFEPEEPYRMVCPQCQNPSADLRSGRELQIRSIEVAERGDDATAYCRAS